MSNLLIRSEIIDYFVFEQVIDTLTIFTAKDSFSLTLSDVFYESFFNSVSFIVTRIRYEYNVNLSKGYLTKTEQQERKSYSNSLADLRKKESELWKVTKRMLLFSTR